ncbi:crotonase/enoyl-CoA hydratase family protein [Maricurvus nonylphenolicus]|uniref:crotonase/enoyl-CoA hydratase family protein n=1 Tax=Maricurvus nonylphenolicus TaxID=1008307 RepID=UPI0036F2C507
MSLVNYERKGAAAVITLQNGKVNVISSALLEELNAALDRAAEEKAIVVLAGQSGIFSGGFDLKEMMVSVEARANLVTGGSKLARRLLAHPYPVIAACTGHSVAMGCFILLGCDYRIGVEGPFKIGLNEIQIGMTMHHVGIELPRERLLPTYFHRCVNLAEMLSPQDATTAGFLDEVVAPEQLEERALALAEQYAQLNLEAHALTKVKMRKELLATLDEVIEIDRQAIMEMTF